MSSPLDTTASKNEIAIRIYQSEDGFWMAEVRGVGEPLPGEPYLTHGETRSEAAEMAADLVRLMLHECVRPHFEHCYCVAETIDDNKGKDEGRRCCRCKTWTHNDELARRATPSAETKCSWCYGGGCRDCDPSAEVDNPPKEVLTASVENPSKTEESE